MRKYYKDKLRDYVKEVNGTFYFSDFKGQYAFSYNCDLDCLALYKIEELEQNKGYYYINEFPYKRDGALYVHDYAITEIFFDGMEEIVERGKLGKNFFENSRETQFKKIRKFFQ